MKNPLRMFRVQRLHIFTDECTSMVAFDPADAKRAYEEWSGDKWDDSYEPFDKQVKDNAIVIISCEISDFDDFKKHRPPFSKVSQIEFFGHVEAPAWLWCLWNGRGFLCSTEG